MCEDGGLVVRSSVRIPPEPSDFSEQKIRPTLAPLHLGVKMGTLIGLYLFKCAIP